MRTFRSTLLGMAILEFKMIFELFGKISIFLSVLKFLELIELNESINGDWFTLAALGCGSYALSYVLMSVYDFFERRYIHK